MNVTIFLFPLLQNFLNSEWRRLIETFHLVLDVSRSIILFMFSGYGVVDLHVCSHIVQLETSMMIAEQDVDVG